MDAPSTRGRFRVLVRQDKIATIPQPIMHEMELFSTSYDHDHDPFVAWHFEGYRATVVSDISLSLAFAGIIHAVDFQLEDA